ncbi:DUF4268 domain-containing protein [Brevundimonas sp.]|uniref:DUF4268 domain-containing protein n=1 Tax=Brevundimonas sp. TaxID=1871086 RepID=UPI0025FA2162|nr:DUF4268 domain-containing protein [Brevundimonas sp.]
MALYRVAGEGFERVAETTFLQEKLQERQDLQRLLRADITVLGDDLMVVTQEFGEWEDSNRRIDLLCLDRDARLVVVEIKRTDDGGHMELQAIRYAAMVSGMTFDQLAAAHARYISGDHPMAEAALLSFLGWENETEGALSDEVRIILVAGNFSREITTAVLWLNKQGLDIQCFRMKPHRLGSEVLVDIQQLIPLPEAADYETKLKAQRQEEKRVQSARREIFSRFWGQLIERSRHRTQVVANRTPSNDHWLTGRIGKGGFDFNFVLNQHESSVECYISFGRGRSDDALAAFHRLEAQKQEIEAVFGGELLWQDLPGKLGCRISSPRMEGGWRTAEESWPDLQERLIDAMVRLENALKAPIMALKV